ncbi:MAG: C10 family peptidase [Kiritimatiellae bacterium]|nr:C10 family peptidase [Kiritimatiellia bacterium]
MKMGLERVAIIAAVAAGLAFPLCAEEVTGDDALAAVAGWVNVKAALGEDFTAQPASVREYPAKDGVGKFYVVSLEGGGFVVTSGDTELEPVIAYSKDGTWVDDAAKNPLLVMLPIDVEAAMMAELSSATPLSSTGGRRLAAAAPNTKAVKWAELMAAAAPQKGGARLQAGRTTSNPNDLRVGKLLATTWGQGDPSRARVAYNYYTPTKAANSNYRFYSGCVATAGGQIMYYHKWPQSSVTLLKNYTKTFENNRIYTATDGYQTAKGSAYVNWDDVPFGGTYNWNKMAGTTTTTYWGTTTTYSDEEKQAIGKLLRDIGISVYMNYASDGSGAQYSCLYLRLLDQFGYANAAYKYGLTEDEWKRGILSNLDAKLPVAVGVPGHAIVADGYGYQNGTLYIHFNMGWEGSSDAWYNPPDLTQAGSAYSSFDTLVYNIYSEGTPDCTIVSGRIKNTSGTVMSGVTVTAVNRTSGARITATTDDKGIYALFLPAGSYSVGTSDGAGSAVATNVTVEACESTRLARETMEQEASGALYGGTGKIRNIHGVEMQLAAVAVPVISPVDGTTFYGSSRTVKITCADAAAEIRYTLDGSEPTASSALYEGQFAVSATTTVKAKAFLCGEWSGATTSATLTKDAYYGAGGLYPDTKENHAAHWLDERAAMQEATGTWSNAVDYVNSKVTFTEGNEFTMTEPSKGATTTIFMKLSFDTWGADTDTDFGDVKAGVRVSTNGCFQAYAFADGAKRWINLTGVTPQANTDYTVKLVLNNNRMTYSVAIVNGNVETPLTSNGLADFAFANQKRTRVEKVLFNGEGKVESLEGSYKPYNGVYISVK